jgi:hypothetical protein
MEFIDAAKKYKHDSFYRCPCQICKNEKDYSSTRTIYSHLFKNSFMPNYNVWTEHEEGGIMPENDEEEDDFVPHFEDDYYSAFFKDTTMGEPEEDAEAQVAEDDLGQMLSKGEEVCETVKESKDLKRMLEDYIILLYPDCKHGHKKLGTILDCCNGRHQTVCLTRDSRSC